MVANGTPGLRLEQRRGPRRDRHRRDRRRPDQPLLRRPGDRAEDPDYPVEVHFPPERPRLAASTRPASGCSRRATSRKDEALDFVRFLLSRPGASSSSPTSSKEYPLVAGVEPDPSLTVPLDEIPAPGGSTSRPLRRPGDDRADAGDGRALSAARQDARCPGTRPRSRGCSARRRPPAAAADRRARRRRGGAACPPAYLAIVVAGDLGAGARDAIFDASARSSSSLRRSASRWRSP